MEQKTCEQRTSRSHEKQWAVREAVNSLSEIIHKLCNAAWSDNNDESNQACVKEEYEPNDCLNHLDYHEDTHYMGSKATVWPLTFPKRLSFRYLEDTEPKYLQKYIARGIVVWTK